MEQSNESIYIDRQRKEVLNMNTQRILDILDIIKKIVEIVKTIFVMTATQ